MNQIPVITIDGPSGSGKGSVSQLLAEKLDWHLLDSGALYRILGVIHDRENLPLNDKIALTRRIDSWRVAFKPSTPSEPARVIFNGKNISNQVRAESTGKLASLIAVNPNVRAAMVNWQQSFRKKPGLVADGRDMGTVIFPNAALKIYLEASAEIRAKRRLKQLLAYGIDVKLASLLGEVRTRDARDADRECAPMKPAKDAIIVDTSFMSIDTVVRLVLDKYKDVRFSGQS